MKRSRIRTMIFATICASAVFARAEPPDSKPGPEFPPELVEFTPYEHNPVFTGRGPGFWDAKIRERGWILRDEHGYRMWYTGYRGQRDDTKQLGLATSPDGLAWTRYPGNPIYDRHWVEDMMVVHHDGTYYMFAEGQGAQDQPDQAQLLTSKDGINWTRQGTLDIRYTDGRPLTPGPFGTPTAWYENSTWYLFYERRDQGVWVATSRDPKVWRNVRDEPVLEPGPGDYDKRYIALNQIIRHRGRYYALYHGTGTPERPRAWCTAIATSTDLIHWKKYPHNPILRDNQSSGIFVYDGTGYRLYAMHDEVRVHLPRQRSEK